MARRGRIFRLLVVLLLWALSKSGPCCGSESDIQCLRNILESVKDPNNNLNSTWRFDDVSDGFICKFAGVECWHPDENRVLNIKLSGMGLEGSFPRGIINCSSLTGLDLSNNKFNGTIPSDVSKMLRYVTSLDLSSNNFTGEIPVDMSNCTYLNVLRLDYNQLSGQIPPELALLNRIKTFSASNNLLTGPVPVFSKNATITVENYANNLELCGDPLPACGSIASKDRNTKIIAGAAIVGATFATIFTAIVLFVFLRRRVIMKDRDPEGNKWTESLKGSQGVKVSMFEKPVSKMRLSDLMKATNKFSKSNIIGTGRTGMMYRAVLGDDTYFMVKRLQESKHSEKEFMSEMATLGMVKHKNLVPLLGYCMANSERFLVYEHMPNGTLHDCLHLHGEMKKAMKWPMRLKIAIGAARGFAWLHHNCNPRIIHRNISSNCILLDANFEPKISDFGLARLMNPIDTHLSTFVNGEFGDLGYVAPEYSRTLMATPKGDVYSFGVVLLELVTGESATRVSRASKGFNRNLVDWIGLLTQESRLESAIDESLVGKGADREIFHVLKVACSCVLASGPKERPTMFEVYQLLRAIGERYNFSTDDEISMPTDNGNSDFLVELIVAQ